MNEAKYETPKGERMESAPDGLDQHTPGAKLDAGKPDASILRDFGRALLAVAEVGTFGAAKYTRGGWQEVTDGYNRYSAALIRHFIKSGQEQLDPDSGLLHDAHMAWNALASLELRLRDMELEKEVEYNSQIAWPERSYMQEYQAYADSMEAVDNDELGLLSHTLV